LANEREKYISLLSENKKNEPKRANDNQNRRKDLIDDMRAMKQDSVQEFATEYYQKVSSFSYSSTVKHRIISDMPIKNKCSFKTRATELLAARLISNRFTLTHSYISFIRTNIIITINCSNCHKG